MTGFIGIIAALIVLGLSMIITRIGTISLNLTGLSWDVASFQARSAFAGTGFTTSEAESIMENPVRRKIVTGLMIAKNAGFVSIIISLILTFGTDNSEPDRLYRLGWLVFGVCFLWFIARSSHVESWMNRVIRKALGNWSDLKIYDYTALLNPSEGYTVREQTVSEEDWITHKKLNWCRINDEGMLILGIHRDDDSYVGAPRGETEIFPGDTLILYGREDTIHSLRKRSTDKGEETQHKKAVEKEDMNKAKQANQEKK